ncbi:MAG: SDR family oxidoreductase [Wenzhouxiangellaceae bacterium]
MSKTALITGGSSGLGLAMAEQLAERGYRLILIARDELKLQAAKASIQKSHSDCDVAVYSCDIGDTEKLGQTFQQISDNYSSIELLVINAGVATINLVRDYPDVSIITNNLQVNLIAAITTAYFAMPLLKPGARMLFISSGFAFLGPAGYSLYAAAKGGMNNFAEAMRREMRSRQVSVHVACPGDIDTPMYHGELEIMPEWMKKKMGRAKPKSAHSVADYILRRCLAGKYWIIPSSDVRMVLWMQRLLPRSLVLWIVDRLLPLPDA